MAGQVPARLVGVRLRASPGGVVATVYRDGVRFARSIRYRRRDLIEWADGLLVASTSEADRA